MSVMMATTYRGRALTRSSRISMAAMAIGMAAAAVPAQGQVIAATDATDRAADRAAESGDIIVTARKTNERLQDVPLAVTAITSDTFLERSQSRVQDYFAAVPGLNINAQGNGQTTLAIRGITTGQTTNPSVGIVIDDIPFGSTSVLGYGSRLLPDLDPASLSQVEVLKGPQGTLYGASSIGGLLKFDTKAPSTDRLAGRVEAGINGVDHGEMGFVGRASLNVPVSDTVAIRTSGFFRRDGGYVDNLLAGRNDVNRTETYGGLVSGLIRPTQALTIKLSALLQDVHGFGTSEVDANYLNGPLFGDLTQRRYPGADHYRIAARLYSATISYDFGPVELVSLTGYGTDRYTASVEGTYKYGDLATFFVSQPGAALLNDFNTKKVSQELRLSSSGKHFIDWTIGGFYTHEDTSADQQLVGLTAAGARGGLLVDSQFPTTYREIAAFGTVTFNLTDRFDVQLGGRYSENRQHYFELDLGPLGGGYTLAQDSKDHKFTYLVTPRFRVNPNLMVYGRLATGYRPGGPNPLSTPDAVATNAPTQFGPDTTTDYELGVKGGIPGTRLTYDLSAYLIDWTDIQLSLTNATTGFIYFVNGPKARSAGIEGSLSLALPGGLRASANASYNDSHLTQPLPAGTGVGAKDERLPFSPLFSGSVNVDQDFRIGSTVATIGGTATRVGRRYGEFGATTVNPRTSFAGYTSFDLRGGVTLDRWSIKLFATNLTDKRGVVGTTPQARSPKTTSIYGVNYIRPRTIGIDVSVSM